MASLVGFILDSRKSFEAVWGSALADWGKESCMEGGWDIAEDGEVVKNAASLEEVGKVEKGDVERVGGEGGPFGRSGELFGVDLEQSEEGVNISGERTVPDNIVGEELHDDCFEGADSLFAESCSHGLGGRGRL